MDGSIPRRALGKQHGDTLTQTLQGTNIRGGQENVSHWPVTRTAVLTQSQVDQRAAAAAARR